VGLQDELIGTFELVALESRRSDGEITHPYGDHPLGMFMFDSAGRYCVQVMDPDQTPDQRTYLAMFGTYVVAEDRHTFTLTPHGSADPRLIGTEVLRHVTFDGALAIFNTPTTHVDGFDVTTYITWRRVT
jgi:Lipocalin-like domain